MAHIKEIKSKLRWQVGKKKLPSDRLKHILAMYKISQIEEEDWMSLQIEDHMNLSQHSKTEHLNKVGIPTAFLKTYYNIHNRQS